MRLRQKPWAEEELAQNPLYLPDVMAHKGRWARLFDNTNPIHLEVGCGKGRFVIESALANPHINYVAIEKEERIICMAARAAREAHAFDNLFFAVGMAEGLAEAFDKGEVSRLYIHFCDPWRSRGKWRKRRLTHANFLQIYEHILGNRGELHFKTDNAELFRFTIGELSARNWHIEDNTAVKSPIQTEYEQKFLALGLQIYRLTAVMN